MTQMPISPLCIISGYLLDLLFGDPRWFPHPVRIIGFFILRLEAFLRGLIKNEKIAGVLLVVLIVIPAYLGVYGMIKIAMRINVYLGIALNVFFIYSSLALKDLKAHSFRIYEELKRKNMANARKALSLVVGRDTRDLAEKEIIRASVETIAENIVDGVISPLFYCFIAGAPLALSYKAINTLDSMVGYKNERYKHFGWASAKIDDLANFIPARISMLFLALASWFCAGNPINALRIGMRDGRKNPSPNSGIPEAAVAGALGVQLGGLNFYNSIPVPKPLIGDDFYPLGINHIKESINLAYASSVLFMAAGVMWNWLWNSII